MPTDVQKLVAKQMAQLPPVIRDAIASGHIAEQMRALAQKHQIHLDEWQKLDNIIMLTVLGLSPSEELVDQIKENTALEQEKIEEIVDDVATTIFIPIREELERSLGHPAAKDEQVSDVEQVRQKVLADAPVEPKNTEPVPHTPPTKLEGSALRGPSSGAYKQGETSAGRRNVVDDPYREHL